ncbi:hypothetical protein XU18_2143 [Perkinsela sp. CCAP 1560/4]|nr:hypothetical protein XU18_2143 [Perkinsela sp. CCAP 1560/4]|eukprot:KNH07167.1 hypothetical protein XU18_2143 [Perkinsela sp. CCAP 1560/4]
MDPFDNFDPSVFAGSVNTEISRASLDSMNEKVILDHLKSQYQALKRKKQIHEGDTSPLSESYCKQLLGPLVANHPKREVKLLAACVLADTLRIVAPAFPFEEKLIVDALQLFSKAIAIIQETSLKDVPLSYYDHLITCLAQTHAIYALCKKTCKADQKRTDNEIYLLVKALLYYGNHEASVAMHCSAIINDTIMAYSTITEDVFHLLMDELCRKSAVAKLVFSSHSMQMQHLVHDHIKRTCDELMTQYEHNLNNPNDKRKVLKKISHLFELLERIAETSTLCIKKTIDTLVKYLSHEQVELRTLFTKGLGKIFESDPVLLLESEFTLNAFIARFDDTRPGMRNEMLRVVHRILSAGPSQSVRKELWHVFSEPIKAKLVDHDESVRRNSVLLITTFFGVVPEPLVKAATLRCRDKKTSVRHFAITQIANAITCIQKDYNTSGILNAILHTYHADNGENQKVVESALIKFTSCFADTFEVLCESLDYQSSAAAETILSKMSRLRLVVCKLFELKRDPSQDETVRKLVHFLAQQFPMENVDAVAEWNIISEVKDSKFLKLIADSFVYADGFREGLERAKRIWRKSTCDYFTRVTGRMLLPISQEYAIRLPQRIRSIATEEKQTGLLRAFCLLSIYDPSATAGIHSVLDVLEKDIADAIKESNSNCHERIRLVLDFFCDTNCQVKAVHDLFRATSFMQKLTTLTINLPLSSIELCKSLAKAQAKFAEPEGEAYDNYLKYLNDQCEALGLVRRSRIKLVYKELMEKGKLMFKKGIFVDADILLNDIRECISSNEEESPQALKASMALQKAYFEAQTNIDSQKVSSYLASLFDAFMGLQRSSDRLGSAKATWVLKHLVALICSCKIRVCVFDNMQLLQSLSDVLGGVVSKDARLEVQKMLFKHVHTTNKLPLQCTVFLFITLLAENDRHNLSKVRDYVRSIVEKYRETALHEKKSQGVTLSDARAITCYPEYIFPILLYLLAHSAAFARERDSGLVSIQRVFVVFFEEVLGRTNESAGFLIELIRQLRSLDDRYYAESPNTRILCEVAARDLQEVLRNRLLSLEAVYSFPGSVQLPHFFTTPRKSSALLESTEFLPNNFTLIRMGFGGLFSLAHSSEIQLNSELEPTPEEPEQEFSDTASQIAGIVKEKYGQLSEHEVALIPWKTMRQEIAKSLGVESLSDDARKYAWKAVQALHEDTV